MLEWFPGDGFKKIARKMLEDRERLYEVPFNFVREQMESQLVHGHFKLLTLVLGQKTSLEIIHLCVSRNERGFKRGGTYQGSNSPSILR